MHQLKSSCCSIADCISFSVFTCTLNTTRRANGMAFEWSYKHQNLSYPGKFLRIFDQGKGNWIQVSREFELSGFELTSKIDRKVGEIQR